MKKTVLITAFIGLLVLGGIGMGLYFNYQNQEVELAEAIDAKIQDNQSHYTKMWEVLTQKAGVSSEYAKQFKEIYPELISGRYSNGQGQMMQWIQEHNPNFDSSLYKDVMRSIESQRESFHTTQRQLIDLSRQHNVLLSRVPSKWFLSSIAAIDIPVVINDKAVEAFKSEREQKMTLYK